MSTNNYILNLLNIKDENIFIKQKIENKTLKGRNYKIIEGFLTYNSEYKKDSQYLLLKYVFLPLKKPFSNTNHNHPSKGWFALRL